MDQPSRTGDAPHRRHLTNRCLTPTDHVPQGARMSQGPCSLGLCRNAPHPCEAIALRLRLRPARRAGIATLATPAPTPRTHHRSRRTGAAARTAEVDPTAVAPLVAGGQGAPGLAARSHTRPRSGGPSSQSPAKPPSRRCRTRSAGTSSSATPGMTGRAAPPSCAPASSPAVRRSGSRAMPATVADPELGAMSVPRARTVVVFPAPFGPRKPNTSPRPTLKVTSSNAIRPPKRFERWSADTAGALGFPPEDAVSPDPPVVLLPPTGTCHRAGTAEWARTSSSIREGRCRRRILVPPTRLCRLHLGRGQDYSKVR